MRFSSISDILHFSTIVLGNYYFGIIIIVVMWNIIHHIRITSCASHNKNSTRVANSSEILIGLIVVSYIENVPDYLVENVHVVDNDLMFCYFH